MTIDNALHKSAGTALIALMFVTLGVTATPALAKQIKLHPGPIPGKVMHNSHARNFAYCEIAPVVGNPPTAQFYNTSAPGDYCPLDKMEALNPKKLAAELGAKFVYLNPTPRSARRHWVMDQLWAFKVGESVDFHGVKGTWVAFMSPKEMRQAVARPYAAVEIHRASKYLYSKGAKVFLIKAPGGKTWVMQSYCTEVDKNLSFDKLPELGKKLKLPAGYHFEVKTLTKDLTIDPRRAGNVAHIMRDELHDVYEGCGFDAACNYTP